MNPEELNEGCGNSVTFRTMAKQYLAMVPMRTFNWTNLDGYITEKDDLTWQLELLEMTIRNDIAKKYPPSNAYSILFMKTLIQKLENACVEIHGEFYQIYTDFMASTEETCNYTCHKTYCLNDSQSVTLKETNTLVSLGTTGLRTWEAALYLAEWCLHNTNELKARKIIELGSGMGLTGLVVSLACQPLSYTFTDCHPSVLENLHYNIGLNMGQQSQDAQDDGDQEYESSSISYQCNDRFIDVKIRQVDWTQDSHEEVEDVDVVLAADVVYDLTIIPHLVNVLKNLLHSSKGRTIVGYVACTIRNKETIDNFLAALDDNAVDHKEETENVPAVFFYSKETDVKIWRLQSTQ